MTLELRSVSKIFDGPPVLSEISLTFDAGQSVAILGRSGSGKSTILRLLAGLDLPTSGQVFVEDVLASEPGAIHLPPHRRGISMVFQDLALWPNLTVLGNVLLGLSGLRASASQRRARALEALALCRIEHLANRKLAQLSGGEEQRVALARAVATRPKFLLLDEPFSGLDLVTKAQVVEEISRLSQTQGLAVILVTHDPFDAIALCGRGIVLEEARIKEAGPLVDLVRTSTAKIIEIFRGRRATILPGPRGSENRDQSMPSRAR